MKHLKTFLENFSDNILNDILDKISKYGIDSLSNHDRNLLDNYANKDFNVEEEIKKHQDKYKQSKEIVKNLGLSIDGHDLEKDIGRYARFKPPVNEEEAEKMGEIRAKGTIFEIVDVQKHWGHNKEGGYVFDMIGYRAVVAGQENDFGLVMSVDETEFINNMTEEEAKKINHELFPNLY